MNDDELDRIIIGKVVATGSCNVSTLCREIKARRERVIGRYKKLVDYGLLYSRKEYREIILTVTTVANQTKIFPNFDDFMRIMMENMEPHIKQLEKVKHLGRHLIKKTGGSIANVDSRAARELDNVIYILNFIGNKYALPYSYADYLDLLPSQLRSVLRQNQKMCAETTKRVIERLLRTHKKSEKELRTYLSWKLDAYMIFDKNFNPKQKIITS